MATDFDAKARTWDADPAKVERARAVGVAIRSAVPLSPSTRLLEYGAGTGLVSEALAGEVGALTLADPSEGMRAVMREKVDLETLPPGARIWDLDLAEDPVPDARFDLVVTVMTLHHIHDLRPVLRGFAELLAGGGWVCIVDLEQEDGTFHDDDAAFEGHAGFSRPHLRAQLEIAGFTDVHFEYCHGMEKDGRIYPLFLAVARTPTP